MPRTAKRSRLILLALIALALVFLLLPGSFGLALRSQALSWLRPVLAAFQPGLAPARMAADAPEGIGDGRRETGDGGRGAVESGSRPQAADPRLPSFDLRAELIRLQEENRRLRAMVGVAVPPAGLRLPRGVTAGVMAREVLWQGPVLGLDRGESDGLRTGLGALCRGVAVGRIVSVGPRAACLALITHPGLTVAARLAEARADGVLKGARDSGSEALCRLAIVSADLQARVGEHVVTSGLDGSFPPGCWLGDVVAIEQKGNLEWELAVRPACETTQVEAVYVLTELPSQVPWPKPPAARAP